MRITPRIKPLDEVHDRAIMIHAGDDNHSEHPTQLDGARMACRVIK